MNARRTRRLLLVAFVLSILIHTLFALSVRWHVGSQEDAVERVTIMHRLRIARVTPPPPTSAPPARPAPTAAPTARSTQAAGQNGTVVGAIARTPEPTAAPTPNPKPTVNCVTEDTRAAIAASPPPPEIPPNARGDATNGTTHVRVDLDDHGVVKATTITETSGNTGLDLVAETMARAAQYTPATHACKAVASTYDFTAKFVPW